MSRRPPLSIYLPFLTSVLLIAGLYVYHWFSVSAQSRYYDERAFRVLALLGGAFAETAEGIRTVMGSSTAKIAPDTVSTTPETAKVPPTAAKVAAPRSDPIVLSMETYLRGGLSDYRVQDLQIVSFSGPTRKGVLRFSPLARSSDFAVQVHYAKAAAAQDTPSTLPECGKAPSICATVELAPVLDSLFNKLGDEFFDDVVIADGTGKVWYQQNAKDNWIVDLAPLIARAEKGTSQPQGEKSADTDADVDADKKGPGQSTEKEHTTAHRSSPVNFNVVSDVELAGSRHRLYVAPVPVLLHDGKIFAPALIAGIYRSGRDARHAVGAPHTFVIWGTLAVLTTITLFWPVLSFFYMGPKARLQRRNVASLVASILISAALLTLLALNASFTLTEWSRTETDLKTLADGITAKFRRELFTAARLLHRANPRPFLSLPVQQPGARPRADDPRQPDFRQQTRALNRPPPLDAGKTPRFDARVYPYFTYLFWIDKDGWQRIKLTVPERATPQTSVKQETYFTDVINGDLAEVSDPENPGPPYRLRVEPIYSPNTHEFFTVIVMPSEEPYVAKILATKLESLVDPVMPPGFGFAVVDALGHVKYHSNSARNLQENFLTESQNDRALQALLSHHVQGSLWVNYMGRPHAVEIRPLPDVTRTPLSLIVFRDTTPSGTVNASIILVFALLMMSWTFPFLLIAPIHMSSRKYPLEVIWPCREHRSNYAHLLVAQTAVLLVFFLTYSHGGPFACTIGWPVLLAYAGVVYPLQQFRGRADWVTVASRVALIVALLAFSHRSWAIVVPLAFAAASHSMVSRRIESTLTEIDLQHLYASMTLTILAVVIVAPACVLFKFAHDSMQRLAVAREEKLTAGAIHQRTRRIDSHFRALELEDVADQRRRDNVDRHDRLLEVKPDGTEPKALRFTQMEAWLPKFFAQFPSNTLGAELQQIAIDGVRDRKPWRSTRTTLTYRPPNGQGQTLEITRPVPVWSGLRLSTTVALALVLVCLYLWFAFVARIVFMLDVRKVPALDTWDPKTLPNGNVLVLGPPRSGRLAAINALDVEMLDLAELSAANTWGTVRIKGDRVCLFYFDFDLDNGETNTRKLVLLERLLYVERVRVILLSSVDPMFYLAGREGRDHGASPSSAGACSQLERWAAVLNRFYKIQLNKAPAKSPDTQQRAYIGNEEARARAFLHDECETYTPLHGIGQRIVSVRPIPSQEELIERLLDKADSHYRLLWTSCAANERLVLFQLARDGWANPKNASAIQQLERRGLIAIGPRGPRIMNESFRRFVVKSQYPAEVALWESEERQSMWRAVQVSVIVGVAVFAGWNFYARPDAMTVMLAILGGVGTAIAAVMRVIGGIRSPFLVATSVRSND